MPDGQGAHSRFSCQNVPAVQLVQNGDWATDVPTTQGTGGAELTPSGLQSPATPLNRTGQQPCDPGSYCVGGVAYTCPVGALSGHGHSSCTNCTAGTFSNVQGVSW